MSSLSGYHRKIGYLSAATSIHKQHWMQRNRVAIHLLNSYYLIPKEVQLASDLVFQEGYTEISCYFRIRHLENVIIMIKISWSK